MKKYTKTELQTKFKDLLKDNDSLICTEDGQAFYDTPQGNSFARGHASKVKCKVVKIGKSSTPEEEVDVWTTGLDNIVKKLNTDKLKAKCEEVGIESEGTKKEMAQAILDKLAEAAE